MAYVHADNVKAEVPDDVVGACSENLNKKDCDMGNVGDIAGLMSLMQNNKGMDLPGLLALCKDKGYDKGWGGEFMFIFVFLILFMWGGGGWGGNGWGNNDRQAAQNLATMAGFNLQDIIGLYDRIAQNQTATQQGFMALDTKLCQSIAEAISATNQASARNYDATRNVGDQVRDCCCTMQRLITDNKCSIDGLYGHTSVLAERVTNSVEKTTCQIENKLRDIEGKMEVGFERVACTINNTAMQTENARQAREIDSLKEALNAQKVAQMAVQQMQAFTLQNYKPTAYGTTAS